MRHAGSGIATPRPRGVLAALTSQQLQPRLPSTPLPARPPALALPLNSQRSLTRMPRPCQEQPRQLVGRSRCSALGLALTHDHGIRPRSMGASLARRRMLLGPRARNGRAATDRLSSPRSSHRTARNGPGSGLRASRVTRAPVAGAGWSRHSRETRCPTIPMPRPSSFRRIRRRSPTRTSCRSRGHTPG